MFIGMLRWIRSLWLQEVNVFWLVKVCSINSVIIDKIMKKYGLLLFPHN